MVFDHQSHNDHFDDHCRSWVILFGFGNHGQAVGISNLWKNGGFFTGGVKGFFFALSIVVASYQGIELIGMTAGEAENPKKTIIEAVQSTIGRILIFILVLFLSL